MSYPDRNQRHHSQHRSAHRPDKVAPRPAAVHQPVEQRQPPLEERVAQRIENDLEVALGPARALLEAVSHLVGGLADREVLLHVAAVPALLLELHAQGEVLGEGVLGGPAGVVVVVEEEEEEVLKEKEKMRFFFSSFVCRFRRNKKSKLQKTHPASRKALALIRKLVPVQEMKPSAS